MAFNAWTTWTPFDGVGAPPPPSTSFCLSQANTSPTPCKADAEFVNRTAALGADFLLAIFCFSPRSLKNVLSQVARGIFLRLFFEKVVSRLTSSADLYVALAPSLREDPYLVFNAPTPSWLPLFLIPRHF